MRCVCDGRVVTGSAAALSARQSAALRAGSCSLQTVWLALCVKTLKTEARRRHRRDTPAPTRGSRAPAALSKLKKCVRACWCVNARQTSPILVACGGSGRSHKERGRWGGEMSERLTDFTFKRRPEPFVTAAGSWVSNRRQRRQVLRRRRHFELTSSTCKRSTRRQVVRRAFSFKSLIHHVAQTTV